MYSTKIIYKSFWNKMDKKTADEDGVKFTITRTKKNYFEESERTGNCNVSSKIE